MATTANKAAPAKAADKPAKPRKIRSKAEQMAALEAKLEALRNAEKIKARKDLAKVDEQFESVKKRITDLAAKRDKLLAQREELLLTIGTGVDAAPAE